MFMTRSTVLILQYDLPNGLLASQNFTNLFGYTKYLNLNLVSYDSRINLVLFQWRLKLFDMKLKTSLPGLRLENNDCWKIRAVRLNEQLILVPGWSGRWWRCWRTPGPQTSGSNFWLCDLKKNGRILTLIRSIDHHFLLTLHWLGNQTQY
jgi:hypothetical protein